MRHIKIWTILWQSLAWLPAAFSLWCAGQDLGGQIQAAQSAGAYQKAAGLYAKLIASGEDSPEIRSNYGVMLYQAGRDSECLEQLHIALRQNPRLGPANLFAGMALSRGGRWSEALPYLERARRLQPTSVVPALALGSAYTGLRDYGRARQAYLQATQLDADNVDAWYGLGITCRSLADSLLKQSSPGVIPPEASSLLHQSLEALTRAVALDPVSPRAHLLMAESLRDSGKFVDALREYQAVLRLNPDDTAALLGLATTYWKSGDPDTALAPLKKVLERLPADPEANGIMANLLVRRGDFKEALPHARKALEGNPNLVQVRFSLAKIYLEQNQPELAVMELRKSAPFDIDGSYHFLLARALRSLGRDAEAAAALEKFKQLRAASERPAEKRE